MSYSLGSDERLDYVNEKITLIQKNDGLTFGTDAFLLAAFADAKPSGVAAELGTGTGIISLLCVARERFSKIYAFEIQEDFADLAQRNAEYNGFNDKLTVICKDIRDCSSGDTEREVDAVFANPPYMKTDSGKPNESDAKFIARHEVCGDISDFCHTAASLLKYGGKFYCVYRPDRLVDLLDAMRKHKLEPKRMTAVHATMTSAPSMVLVEAKKGASPSLILTRPLILTGENGTETADIQRIYETCSFEEFLKR